MMEGENEMLASMLSDMALRFKKKKQIDKTRLEEKSLQVLMKNLPKYDDPELFAFVPVGYLEYLWKRATDFETLNTDTAPLFYNSKNQKKNKNIRISKKLFSLFVIHSCFFVLFIHVFCFPSKDHAWNHWKWIQLTM